MFIKINSKILVFVLPEHADIWENDGQINYQESEAVQEYMRVKKNKWQTKNLSHWNETPEILNTHSILENPKQARQTKVFLKDFNSKYLLILGLLNLDTAHINWYYQRHQIISRIS